MPRSVLVAVALAVSATSALTARAGSDELSASPRWSGSASCTIAVTGPGYQHSETQKWQVKGPASVTGAFLLVPSKWTDTGSGSSTVTQGDQTRTASWTVNAAAPGKFKFVVRASDGKLLIGQGNAQLRVANGITGQQQLTIAGVPQTPGPVGLEAFETQLPLVVVKATTRTVSGSTKPTRVVGSFGPFQPGAATATKRCNWKFAKTGN
ncbi:MAG TPA: hypothetical protein VH063_14155 [Gaiellaceae bacterium]|nr:hypothetical protein [Gaiellaceae bacterium]